MAATVQPSPRPFIALKMFLRKHALHSGAALALTALLPLTGCASSRPPKSVKVANNFDAHRFQGTWYEILRFNHPDEAGLTRVTAKYSQQADGKWLVTDRAWQNATGQWVGSTSEIRNPDQQPGTLKLKHKKPRHVILIDNDHTLAVLCSTTAQQFTIIAKNPDPDPARLERIMVQAENMGFPIREAFWVPTK